MTHGTLRFIAPFRGIFSDIVLDLSNKGADVDAQHQICPLKRSILFTEALEIRQSIAILATHRTLPDSSCPSNRPTMNMFPLDRLYKLFNALV